MSSIREIHTDKAPAAIGPYSQGVTSEGVVYTAGQIALDPETGTMVGDGDIRIETRRVLDNLTSVLRAAGSDLHKTLRVDVFLIDLADFDAMNEIYAEAMGVHKPARLTVQVAALPKGARIEIAAIGKLM